ncbi:hypothetical protein VNO80_10744 [Phaseolus coccineus]|uniref:Uncharacterized protein n=1 Tax=Phaseolus coccineus TaxID=3886 RepID=A0AAN9N8R4_PHACN
MKLLPIVVHSPFDNNHTSLKWKALKLQFLRCQCRQRRRLQLCILNNSASFSARESSVCTIQLFLMTDSSVSPAWQDVSSKVDQHDATVEQRITLRQLPVKKSHCGWRSRSLHYHNVTFHRRTGRCVYRSVLGHREQIVKGEHVSWVPQHGPKPRGVDPAGGID